MKNGSLKYRRLSSIRLRLFLLVMVSLAFSPACLFAGEPCFSGYRGGTFERERFAPPARPAIQMAYIYGYHNSLVMAQVTNGNKDQVAFSSFESDDKGYWSYSGTPVAASAAEPGRTGEKYYALGSGNIQRTGLPAGRYLLSYWASTDASVSGTNYSLLGQSSGAPVNGWTFYEKTINLSAGNSSLTLSGSGKIDELRLHPFEAQMTTFTYDPLIGKTSETDANNATLFYEYDEFNRIRCIRDMYGDVIKSYSYHYIHQP